MDDFKEAQLLGDGITKLELAKACINEISHPTMLR